MRPVISSATLSACPQAEAATSATASPGAPPPAELKVSHNPAVMVIGIGRERLRSAEYQFVQLALYPLPGRSDWIPGWCKYLLQSLSWLTAHLPALSNRCIISRRTRRRCPCRSTASTVSLCPCAFAPVTPLRRAAKLVREELARVTMSLQSVLDALKLIVG